MPSNQANGQAHQPNPNLRRANNWKPGESGNPLGPTPMLKARSEAQQRRRDEIIDVIDAEFGGLTAFEAVLAGQAADCFERAERTPIANDHHIRLARTALEILDRIRDGRRERQAAKPAVSAFDAYLAEKATAR